MTIPLETLIEELERDPEVKAAMDEARKTIAANGLTIHVEEYNNGQSLNPGRD